MGEKSLQKKKYIIETAKKVFVKKGFKSVTMKDIVEACEISRGGLYLYFNSTEELFNAVLEAEKSKVDPDIAQRLSSKPSNNDILTMFFYEQKKEILEPRSSLIIAMYEYSFYLFENKQKTLLHSQKTATESFLCKLFREGNETKEFDVKDIEKTARHIVYALEGLKLTARTGQITEEEVNDEMVMLMQTVLPKQ